MKKLVPIAVVVLAVGAGIALALLWNPDPETNGVADNAGNEGKPFTPTPIDKKDRIRREFDPTRLTPDPVVIENPPQLDERTNFARMVVSGRIVDANGVGVPNASVSFIGAGSARGVNGTATTRTDGGYQLLAWSQNVTTLNQGVKACVLVETTDGRRTLSPEYEVADVNDATLPDVKLELGGSIEGRVVTSDGLPAGGARVELKSASAQRDVNYDARRGYTTTHRQIIRVVWTDDRGVFRADGLARSKYRLTCRSTYHGINTNAEIADIETGPTAWVELSLRSTNFIRGVLKDQSGLPVAGAVVPRRAQAKERRRVEAQSRRKQIRGPRHPARRR